MVIGRAGPERGRPDRDRVHVDAAARKRRVIVVDVDQMIVGDRVRVAADAVAVAARVRVRVDEIAAAVAVRVRVRQPGGRRRAAGGPERVRAAGAERELAPQIRDIERQTTRLCP